MDLTPSDKTEGFFYIFAQNDKHDFFNSDIIRTAYHIHGSELMKLFFAVLCVSRMMGPNAAQAEYNTIHFTADRPYGSIFNQFNAVGFKSQHI